MSMAKHETAPRGAELLLNDKKQHLKKRSNHYKRTKIPAAEIVFDTVNTKSVGCLTLLFLKLFQDSVFGFEKIHCCK